MHVLGESRVIECLSGLVVTYHQPSVMAVGQSDGVYRTELLNFCEERERIVTIEGTPRLERRRHVGVSSVGRRARAGQIFGPVPHWTNPEHKIRSHEILQLTALK